MADALFWILLVSTIILFILSAKTHGRQLRVERELMGHDEVDFRRKVENAAWVEALWREDRKRYWTTLPILAVLFALLGYGISIGGFARPGTWGIGEIIVLLLFAPILTFLGIALANEVRFEQSFARPSKRGEFGPKPRAGDSKWIRAARLGSLAWLLSTWIAAIGILGLLFGRALL